jgi:hypothetical protein
VNDSNPDFEAKQRKFENKFRGTELGQKRGLKGIIKPTENAGETYTKADFLASSHQANASHAASGHGKRAREHCRTVNESAGRRVRSNGLAFSRTFRNAPKEQMKIVAVAPTFCLNVRDGFEKKCHAGKPEFDFQTICARHRRRVRFEKRLCIFFIIYSIQ